MTPYSHYKSAGGFGRAIGSFIKSTPRGRNSTTAGAVGSAVKSVVKPLTQAASAAAGAKALMEGASLMDQIKDRKEVATAKLLSSGVDPAEAGELAGKATWGTLGHGLKHYASNPWYYGVQGGGDNPIDQMFAAGGSGSYLPQDMTTAARQLGSMAVAGSPISAVMAPTVAGLTNRVLSTGQNAGKALQDYQAQQGGPLNAGVSALAAMPNSRYAQSLREYYGDDFAKLYPLMSQQAPPVTPAVTPPTPPAVVSAPAASPVTPVRRS